MILYYAIYVFIGSRAWTCPSGEAENGRHQALILHTPARSFSFLFNNGAISGENSHGEVSSCVFYYTWAIDVSWCFYECFFLAFLVMYNPNMQLSFSVVFSGGYLASFSMRCLGQLLGLFVEEPSAWSHGGAGQGRSEFVETRDEFVHGDLQKSRWNNIPK